MKRVSSLLLAGLLCACGDSDPSPFTALDAGGPDSGLPPLDAATDRAGPDRVTPDVVDLTDVAPKDAAGSDAPCAAALVGAVRFGRTGGRTAVTTRYVLTPPLAFRAERTGAGAAAMCETALPGCNTADMVDVGEVNAALGARDVGVAFGMATGGMERVYGVDTRPMDGQVFTVSLDGATVIVGEPCRVGGTGCLEIPTGLQRLVDVLSALRDQEMLRPACAALRGM